ncbi:MAG: hypothetical protein IJT30_11930 [Muribaculaceae bacterium]|nr:hypothetical protein [Muribaculaceae bacterium]
MKQITILLFVAMLLAGCGTATCSASQAGEGSTNSYTFLTQLGVDVHKIPTLGSKVEFAYGDELVALTNDQTRALLNDIYHFDTPNNDDGDMEGMFYIAGAHPVAGDRMLLLFHIEYGDGSGREMAIYDHNGRLTDFLDTGSWNSCQPNESNDDFTRGTAYHELASCEFNAQKPEFTLRRDFALSDFFITDDGTIAFDNIHWELLKDYSYTITDDGKFRQQNVHIEQKGPVNALALMLDAISDLNYLPASDPSRLDQLAALMQRADVRSDLANPDGMATYRLQGVMQGTFEQNGTAVLHWLAGHRSSTQVIELLKSVFASGWIPKYRMTQELQKLPAGEERTWLERLTAQWGPDGAVG